MPHNPGTLEKLLVEKGYLKTILEIITLRNIVLCLLVFIIAYFYLYKINLHPEYDNDEAVILNFHYRVATYGEYRMPVGFQKAFDNEHTRVDPNLLCGFFRNLFHRIIGFSPKKTRVISAFMILTVVVTIGLLSVCIFRSPWLSLLPIIIVGLHPNVVMAARSFRHEQEICFLGMLGMFAIPLLNKSLPWLTGRILLMFLAGLLVGWAATLHPWGMVFMTVMFFTFVFYSSAWEKEDGISLKVRLFTWGSGVALPCLLVLSTMILNWHNYSEFISTMGKLYDIQDRIARNVSHVAWLTSYLPDWIVAHIPLLDHYTLHRQAYHPYYKFYRIIFWVEILFVMGYAVYSLFKEKQTQNIFVVSASWLAIGFFVMFFLYPPTSNYFLYPALAISLGFSFMGLSLWENGGAGRSRFLKVIKGSALLIMISLTVANGIYLFAQSRLILRLFQNNDLISLDTRFSAIAKMGDLTGIDRLDKPVLCDFMTWIAGGRHQGSLFETNLLMLVPVPQDLGGVIFELPYWQSFLNAGKKFGTMQEKLNRFRELLQPLDLAGVVFEKRSSKSYYFYMKKNQAPSPFIFGVISGENDIVWGTSQRDAGTGRDQISGEDRTQWQNLSKGLYVLAVRHNDVIDYTVRVNYPTNQNLDYEINLKPLPVYRIVERQVLIEVQQGGGNVQLLAKKGAADSTLHRLVPMALSSPQGHTQ